MDPPPLKVTLRRGSSVRSALSSSALALPRDQTELIITPVAAEARISPRPPTKRRPQGSFLTPRRARLTSSAGGERDDAGKPSPRASASAKRSAHRPLSSPSSASASSASGVDGGKAGVGASTGGKSAMVPRSSPRHASKAPELASLREATYRRRAVTRMSSRLRRLQQKLQLLRGDVRVWDQRGLEELDLKREARRNALAAMRRQTSKHVSKLSRKLRPILAHDLATIRTFPEEVGSPRSKEKLVRTQRELYKRRIAIEVERKRLDEWNLSSLIKQEMARLRQRKVEEMRSLLHPDLFAVAEEGEDSDGEGGAGLTASALEGDLQYKLAVLSLEVEGVTPSPRSTKGAGAFASPVASPRKAGAVGELPVITTSADSSSSVPALSRIVRRGMALF
eukprot:PLAT3155.2.p1 GENE.PLAT3155.2~~PLAT3155.2.p1  ORF type:complete len:409 (+),score=140.49 PLAT3155.2:43-1227(+)